MKIFPDIGDQIATMRRHYPELKVLSRERDHAIWRGPLRPVLQTFDVEISYRVPMVVERINLLRLQPRVRIVSPQLKRRRGDAEGELPHVYWASDRQPVLCLFDPETREWTPDDLLAETTVPYTIDWLACYEGWRATGKWTGGGRHGQKERDKKEAA